MRVIIAFGILLLLSLSACSSNERWSVSEDGSIIYADRQLPHYALDPIEKGSNYTLYRISYPSADATIIGFLLEPAEQSPGVVLLPGAGETKEAELSMARTLASNGYAVLTIDLRGSGESTGALATLQADYEDFSRGIEPVSHKYVYDALLAFDILDSRTDANVAVLGESFGGRNALIAAAIEPRISGAVLISTSGFVNDEEGDVRRFVNSINPVFYAPRVSPRPVAMIHSTLDDVVPIAQAQYLFEQLGQPHVAYTLEECGHGYCDAMRTAVLDALANATA